MEVGIYKVLDSWYGDCMRNVSFKLFFPQTTLLLLVQWWCSICSFFLHIGYRKSLQQLGVENTVRSGVVGRSRWNQKPIATESHPWLFSAMGVFPTRTDHRGGKSLVFRRYLNCVQNHVSICLDLVFGFYTIQLRKQDGTTFSNIHLDTYYLFVTTNTNMQGTQKPTI